MLKPLMKTMFSPSGSHCRSLLIPPSAVNCFGSEPSTFTIQISLLAISAILSAPPKTGSEGRDVSVGVDGSAVSVAVDCTSATGTLVGLSVAALVSAGSGANVDVLTTTGVGVGEEFLF